jgi:hypothetical protein
MALAGHQFFLLHNNIPILTPRKTVETRNWTFSFSGILGKIFISCLFSISYIDFSQMRNLVKNEQK